MMGVINFIITYAMLTNVIKLFYYYLKILIIIFYIQSNILADAISPYSKWDGWKFNTDAGIFNVIKKNTENYKIITGPCLGFNFEYGKSFGTNKQFYYGFNTVFNAFIPDSLSANHLTLFSGEKLISVPDFIIPIFEFTLGYNKDNSQLNIGSSYFWGLKLEYRNMFRENTYFFVKSVVWMDKMLFNKGLHDNYITVGIGFKF